MNVLQAKPAASANPTPTDPKDEIFKAKLGEVGDFNFGKKVAEVFDDMLGRSVPFYAELQRMIGEMAVDFAGPGSTVYDLGCSTGTTLLNLDRNLPSDVRLVGVDYSAEMLARCQAKLKTHGSARPFELIQADLTDGTKIENASLVVMVLTLQFIRP